MDYLVHSRCNQIVSHCMIGLFDCIVYCHVHLIGQIQYCSGNAKTMGGERGRKEGRHK